MSRVLFIFSGACKKRLWRIGVLFICIVLGFNLGVGLARGAALAQAPLVVIDPGHGGFDGGCGVGGPILEKELNLKMGMLLARELQRFGLAVSMTRTDDRHLGPTHRRDLLARVDHIRQVRANVAVCLHADWNWRNDQKGAYVFFPRSSAESRLLAEIVQSELNRLTGSKQTPLPAADLLVIREAGCPAILVEVGFLSNAAESRQLASPVYQAEIAQALMIGLVRYFVLSR